MGLRQAIVAAAWIVIASLTPRVAEACSCFVIQNDLLVSPGGELPVDSRGVLWDVGDVGVFFRSDVRYQDLSPAEQIAAQRALLVDWIELWRIVDGQPQPEAFELELVEGLWLIVPARGLSVGDRYRVRAWTIYTRALDEHRGEFELEGLSEDQARQVDFVVGGSTMAKPGPWKLSVGESHMGLLRVEPGPGCSSEIMAKTLALELAPPPGMSANEFELYQFETHVDGVRWSPRNSNCQVIRHGRNWTEQAGSDLVYLGCPERTPGYAPESYEVNGSSFIDSLAPGRHEAHVRAYLPVQGRSYESNTVAFELDCTGELELQSEAEAEPEHGLTPEPLPAPTTRRGCSLERSGPAGSLVVLALLGLGWVRRRRVFDDRR